MHGGAYQPDSQHHRLFYPVEAEVSLGLEAGRNLVQDVLDHYMSV